MSRPCGEMGRSPAALVADWVAGGQPPTCLEAPGWELALTGSGREAIALAMRRWSVGPGDEVLVPAYNCGSEVGPAMATGARVLMYRIDGKAEFDLHDIVERLSARTKVICVTHYFGRPADLRDLAQICQDRGVKLLEDCAHSLFDAGVGRSGDAAIFSLRKSLPASDGGALAIRDVDRDKELDVAASPQIAARGTLSLVKKWAQRKFWIRSRSANDPETPISAACKSGHPDVPSSYYFTPSSPISGASRLARGLLNRIDWSEIVQRRRTNYHLLHGLVRSVRGFVPLWDEDLLAPGVCPLGLPGLVEDKNRWVSALNRAGVSVSPWWSGFFRGLDWSEFPEARILKQRLILLPVHQGLTSGDMEYIAATARHIG